MKKQTENEAPRCERCGKPATTTSAFKALWGIPLPEEHLCDECRADQDHTVRLVKKVSK